MVSIIVFAFYTLLVIGYFISRSYANSISYCKLISRSERAIWKRDFIYCLNWIALALVKFPLIGFLIYFFFYEDLQKSEMFMYMLLFVFFAIFVFKGIQNYILIHNQIKNITEKPDLVKKSRSTNIIGLRG